MRWSDKVLAKTIIPFIPISWLPNYITFLRVCLVPVVGFFLWKKYYEIGLLIFLLAASTDWLDGALARTRNQVTVWGKLFDPLADKLLVCVVVFILIFRFLDPRIGLATIFFELTMIASAIVKKIIGVEVKANGWGKTKMFVQIFGISLVLIGKMTNISEFSIVGNVVLYLALGLGVVSLGTYSV